jgi:hypothetical protein
MLRAAMESNPTSSALVDLRALSALSPARRVDALLSRQDAKAAVQSLEPFALYHLVREVGLDDCAELCVLASDEQVQAFVDLDCWRRDEVDTLSFVPWLKVFLEAEDERLRRFLTTLDPEPLVLMLKESLIVFHLEDGIPPAEIEEQGIAYETLDGVWAYAFTTQDDDRQQLIRNLLRRFYHIDVLRARTALEAVSWELIMNMTETAYADRSIRLAEMGFLPFDEAAALYARKDLQKLRAELVGAAAEKSEPQASQHLGTGPLPDIYRERFTGGTFFESCIAAAQLPDVLGQQIVAVANKALAAEPADPRDLEAVRVTFDRVRGLLDIGLEFLAAGSVELGADLLETAHIQRIVEAGHNVVMGLADQARRVFGSPEVGAALTVIDDVPFSLLETEDRGLVQALLKARPMYHARGESYARPFGSSADARTAASRLTMLAFEVTALYGLLGVAPGTLREVVYREDVHPAVELVSMGTLLRTCVLLWALDAPEPLRALTAQEIGGLAPIRAETLVLMGSARLATAESLDDDARAIADVWLRRVAQALEEELGGLSSEALRSVGFDASHLGTAVLISR